jgi:hypothetical protein
MSTFSQNNVISVELAKGTKEVSFKEVELGVVHACVIQTQYF